MVVRISDPMTYNCNILLGRITKVSGYEGAVTVKLEKIFTENIPLMESVFLEIDGRPVPFFVSATEYSGAGSLKLEFEGCHSASQVSEFAGCRVFLTSTPLSSGNETEEINRLKGYRVFYGDNNFLGSVKEIIPNPGQWLFSISSPENKEILIPFHEHFIVSIDNDMLIVVMDLPDGLIEIN
jgi:16S rRNA processing protein RimM